MISSEGSGIDSRGHLLPSSVLLLVDRRRGSQGRGSPRLLSPFTAFPSVTPVRTGENSPSSRKLSCGFFSPKSKNSETMWNGLSPLLALFGYFWEMLTDNPLWLFRQTQSAGVVWALFPPANDWLSLGFTRLSPTLQVMGDGAGKQVTSSP